MTRNAAAPASTGPRFDAPTVARALLSGDGTFSLTGQPYRGDGIIVAVTGYGAEYDVRHLDAAQRELLVRLWVEDVASGVTSRPAPFHRPRYLGSWVDSATGLLYLDVVEVFSREDRDEAIAAGAFRNQIAIWDAGRGEEIATGGTGAVE